MEISEPVSLGMMYSAQQRAGHQAYYPAGYPTVPFSLKIIQIIKMFLYTILK